MSAATRKKADPLAEHPAMVALIKARAATWLLEEIATGQCTPAFVTYNPKGRVLFKGPSHSGEMLDYLVALCHQGLAQALDEAEAAFRKSQAGVAA